MLIAWSVLLIGISCAQAGFNFHANSNGPSSIRLTFSTPPSFIWGDVSYGIVIYHPGPPRDLTSFNPPNTAWNHNGLNPASNYIYEGYVYLRGRPQVWRKGAWTAPIAPGAPTLGSRNSNGIVMNATPIPDNRQAYFYKLNWSQRGQSQSHEVACTGLTCSVTGLQPATDYVFSIVGCFSPYAGNPWAQCSAASATTTEWTAPSSILSWLAVRGADSLQVKYEPIAGGSIEYAYKLIGNGVATDCNAASKTCELQNLKPASQYNLTVVACFVRPDGSGELCGNAAAGMMIQWTAPAAVAEAGVSTHESTSLQITFSPLEDNKHTYVYQVRVTDQVVTCDSGVCNLNNLHPSTLYTMKIAACFCLPDGSTVCGDFDGKVVEAITSPM